MWDPAFLKSLKARILKDPTESMRKHESQAKGHQTDCAYRWTAQFIGEDSKAAFDQRDES